MEYKNIKNPVWANREKTHINLTVDIKINNAWETLPFTASETDSEKHGRDIFDAAVKKGVGDFVVDLDAVKQTRIRQIKSELSALDEKSIRPMREGDTEYLATIKAQVTVLRAELQGLLDD